MKFILDYLKGKKTITTEDLKKPINKYDWERQIGKRRKPFKKKRFGKNAAQHGQPGCFAKCKSPVKSK